MENEFDMEVRVLFTEHDDNVWTAQCLEYDIAVQAKSFSELKHEFERVFMAYLVLDEESDGQILAKLGKAPQKYWDSYEESDENELSLDKQAIHPASDGQPKMPRRHVRIAESAHV